MPQGSASLCSRGRGVEIYSKCCTCSLSVLLAIGDGIGGTGALPASLGESQLESLSEVAIMMWGYFDSP